MKGSTMSHTPESVRNRYDAATAGMEAYAIIAPDGTMAGRIIIRGRATASGRCIRAFFHLFGHPMTEGVAHGGGYDMAAAALAAAINKHPAAAGEIGPWANYACKLDSRHIHSMPRCGTMTIAQVV
jgi:hypothetical protein